MPNRTLKTIGVPVPQDFPKDPYESVIDQLQPHKGKNERAFEEFIAGWAAIAHRFLDCASHDEAFTYSVKHHGSTPEPPERHLQERALFGFFVTGLSALESASYALWMAGAMDKPAEFPIGTSAALQGITPGSTRDKYKSAYPGTSVTAKLEDLMASSQWQEWKELRNILTHRSAPGRHISLIVGTPALSSVLRGHTPSAGRACICRLLMIKQLRFVGSGSRTSCLRSSSPPNSGFLPPSSQLSCSCERYSTPQPSCQYTTDRLVTG
jgi:hypothetical protein